MIGRRGLLRSALAISMVPVSSSRARGQRGEITVALAGPMSGEGAYYGQLMGEAASVACDYVNERGGVAGRRLTCEIEDDGGDPEQAVSVANRIAAKKLPFVIGLAFSATSLPASEVYRENGIFMLAPISSDIYTRAASPYLLRLVPPNHSFESRLFEEIRKAGPSRVAIIHNKVEYGRGPAELFREDLRKAGWPEPLFEGVNNGDKDFYSLVEKMKEWRAETIILSLYPVEAGLILRQAAERKLPVSKVFGHGMLVTPAFTATAGSAAKGVLVVATRGCDPAVVEQETQRDDMARDMAQAFLKRGLDPYRVTTYPIIFSAFQIVAEVVASAGAGDAEVMSAAIHGRSFQTVRGRISFTGKGELADAESALALYEMSDSGARLVKNYGRQPV